MVIAASSAPISGSGGALPVVVVQHCSWGHAGLIMTALTSGVGALGDGIPIKTINFAANRSPEIPPASSLGGLVVLGGPMSALDDTNYPGLAAERQLIRDAVALGVPVFGVGLGMQLLAVSLGAELLINQGSSPAYAPVALTGDGIREPMFYPLVAESTPDPTVLQWHQDSITLPTSATLLATGPGDSVQAFRYGSALGIQFHIELNRAQLDLWLDTPEITAGLDASALSKIRADAEEVLPSLAPRAVTGLSAFTREVMHRRQGVLA